MYNLIIVINWLCVFLVAGFAVTLLYCLFNPEVRQAIRDELIGGVK